MYVIASFERTSQMELAISSLEKKGLKREDLFTIPLKHKKKQVQQNEKIHWIDVINLFDTAVIFGTSSAVINGTYAYEFHSRVLRFGLIGLGIGGAFGLFWRLIINKIKKYFINKNKMTKETVLLIKCYEIEVNFIEIELYNHSAIAVAKLNNNSYFGDDCK